MPRASPPAVRRLARHVVAVTLAAAGAISCGDARHDRIARTVLALDQGIDALTDRSADYRTVLRTVSTHLPRGGDDSVGAAINRFLERVPADGADFHCDADFVRLRARQELIRIE